jgi:hypothetical protein
VSRPATGAVLIAAAASACTLALALALAADEDDDAAKPREAGALPSLSAEQQRAVGLRVARPLAASAPQRAEALGVILDPSLLVADAGEAGSAAAAQRAAAAEAARVQQLYDAGAGASLRMLQAAQAEQARLTAQQQLASARFMLHWGPLATLPARTRQRIIESAARGRSLLARADLPGRHSLGVLPPTAVLEVDGIEVPGRVLGPMRQTAEPQGASLLIVAENAPTGLGAGAHVPIVLLSGASQGLLVPREALLYDEHGAYVYKRSGQHYAPVKVALLQPYGAGWLVKGLDDDDEIVVHGAGVLWSLQGVGARAADADDDED